MAKLRSKVGERPSFRAGRIWAYVRNHPGCTVREVAEHFRWRIATVSTRMNAMKTGGHLSRDTPHKARNTRWWATGPRPVDNRGSHPSSLLNLRMQTPEQHAAALRKALISIGRDPSRVGMGRDMVRRQSKTFGECALAQAWNMPVSRTQQGD